MTKSRTVYDAFRETASRNPGKPALIYLGEKYSYRMLRQACKRAAAALARIGIGRGDKVMLYTPNCPQWVVLWLGIQRIGAVAVPLSPIYTERDLEYIAVDSGAKTILCADTNFGYVKKLREKGILQQIIVTNLADMLPWWKKLVGVAFDRIPNGRVDGENVIRFSRFLKVPPLEQAVDGVTDTDTFEILYTGGTTKFPKGVPMKHALYLDAFEAQLKISAPLVEPAENIIVQGAPLFHVLGQLFGMGPICLTGATVILMPTVNLDAIMLYIQRYRARTLFGVPTLYRMILDHDRTDFYDLSTLKYCFTGGDVLPIEVMRRWHKKFGVRIYQGYGATETCGGVTMVPVEGDPPEDTIGTVLPFKTVRVVDPETLSEIPEGETGELLSHSADMIEGYWNKEEETRECFVQIDGTLWYRTGDLVRLDPQGFMYFVDRTADMIKHKGYRISASEIEAILKDHSSVIAACVVGIPDRKVGERIKGFVVLKEDAKGITGYELRRWCKGRMTAYKVPDYIEFRDMLPKSKVGKYLRRELRKEERERETA